MKNLPGARWARLIAAFTMLLGLSLVPPGWAGEPAVKRDLAQAPSAPAARPVTIRGTIAAVDGQRLTVSTAGGEVRVTLAEPLAVIGAVGARLSDIAPGAYVGTAAHAQPDGTFRSIEVHIFPETMRGTGEGHRPWERPETTMTNATVEAVVQRAEGSLLTLKHKDGETRVVVPPDTPIVRYVPGDRSLIVPGASVVLIGARRAEDGTIRAPRVTVGVGGTKLPM